MNDVGLEPHEFDVATMAHLAAVTCVSVALLKLLRE